MKRRDFILAGAAGLVMSKATASVAAEAWVNDLNSMMNSIQTAYALFSQTDSAGRNASGKFFLQKPGKMRFEYDQADYPLIIADGTTFALLDPKSNTQNQKYPQSETPVSLLSKSNVDYGNSRFVQKLAKEGNTVNITMYDPARTNIGQLIVRVDLGSRTIKGWQSIDGKGARTTVNLKNFNTGVAMNPAWFNIVAAQNSL